MCTREVIIPQDRPQFLSRRQTPIDVYDTATWMCISTLSEQSICTGGMPQSIPDFTRGRWMERKDISQLHDSLDV